MFAPRNLSSAGRPPGITLGYPDDDQTNRLACSYLCRCLVDFSLRDDVANIGGGREFVFKVATPPKVEIRQPYAGWESCW